MYDSQEEGLQDARRDNSSRRVWRYLRQQEGFFVLHFLSPYSPEHNRIERLWQEVHKNVTRNHRCPSIEELMTRVGWYLHRQARTPRRRKAVLFHKRASAKVAA